MIFYLYWAPFCIEGWDEALNIICRWSFETVLSSQNAEALFKSIEDLPVLVIANAEDSLVSLNARTSMDLTGYPFRTIKLKDELAHGDNNGLDIPVRLLEPIKKQSHSISYDNFCQLASMIAAEVTGGCDVRFHPGGRAAATEMSSKKSEVIKLIEDSRISKQSYLKIHFLVEFELSVDLKNILVVGRTRFSDLIRKHQELVPKMDKNEYSVEYINLCKL
ncbi:hypothetical protein C5167_051098 [Papaver somniferum]|uniref:Uncharacterized protein n=1 Tax=Papaver somniferum TaxID=3469 RepID=A0A4Y7KU18_PAPSO|nr:hypothetical protein C5167_051098 [Papaver somniferum]